MCIRDRVYLLRMHKIQRQTLPMRIHQRGKSYRATRKYSRHCLTRRDWNERQDKDGNRTAQKVQRVSAWQDNQREDQG